ncbi:hypothetical protein ACIBCC_30055 [Streptomyces griseus]|uniref:hypothetical protein n=1 Tax=Streptomyces griseus TaxID=1911 RepID=UPI003796E7CF
MFDLLYRVDRVRALLHLRRNGFHCESCGRLTVNRPAAPWPGKRAAVSCTPCDLDRQARADRMRPELIAAADRLLVALRTLPKNETESIPSHRRDEMG